MNDVFIYNENMKKISICLYLMIGLSSCIEKETKYIQEKTDSHNQSETVQISFPSNEIVETSSAESNSDTSNPHEEMLNAQSNNPLQTVKITFDDVLKDIQQFPFEIKKISLLDEVANASIAGNFLSKEGEQFTIVVHWPIVNNKRGNLEFIKVKLPDGIQEKITTNILEAFYALRQTDKELNVFYLLTKSPTKIYKMDISLGSINLIEELFKDSNQAPSSRAFNSFSNTKNLLCGSHSSSPNNIFHKDSSDVVKYFKTSIPFNQIFCLEKSVIIYDGVKDYYLVNGDGEKKIFSNTEYSCSSFSARYYQEGFGIYCTQKVDGKNIAKYFLIDESVGALQENKMLASFSNRSLPYLTSLDLVNNTRLKPEGILYYRPMSLNDWSPINLGLFSSPRLIYSLASRGSELMVFSNNAFFKLKDDVIEKISLSFNPRWIVVNSDSDHLVSSTGAISSINMSLPTNDHFNVITKSIDLKNLNPAPAFSQSIEKISISEIQQSGSSLYYFSVGKPTKIYQRSLKDFSERSIPLEMGESILSFNVNDKVFAAVTKKLDGTYYLKKWDIDLNNKFEKTLNYKGSVNLFVTVVNDGFILVDKLNVYKYDFEFNQKWSRPYAGVISTRLIQLRSGYLLGMQSGVVSLIDNKNGKLIEVESLKDQALSSLNYIFQIHDERLYISNPGLPSIVSISLPHSLLEFTAEE